MDDGLQLRYGTGIGRYTQYLFDELQKRKDITVELTDYIEKNHSKTKERLRYLQYINSNKYRRASKKYDVIHYTNFVIPFCRSRATHYVATVHDLTAFLQPQAMSRMASLYYRMMIRYTIKHADMIITVSKAVRNEIMRMFPNVATPIEVCYSGVYEGLTYSNGQISYSCPVIKELKDKKFFLFVGTIEKRKNIGFVIKAFLKFKESFSEANDYKLVLAGREGYGCDEFHRLADSSFYGKDVIFTGYITDEDRNGLYNHAAAFIFPTLYEGFGIPQLECMKCHLPIILSDIPVNREISGEYGEYFSLSHEDELITEMEKIILNKIDYTKKFDIADAKLPQYNWGDIAEYLIEIYKKASDNFEHIS